MKTLGEKLKEKRKSKNMSQEDVAKRLNIKRETYTCWELGLHNPTVDYLVRLADFYETSTDYLLGRYT